MNKSIPNFDKKKAILAVLTLISIFIWYNGLRFSLKKKNSATSGYLEISSAGQKIKQKKRAGYKDWGRDPFVITQTPASHSSALALGGIVYDEKDNYVLINDQVLHIGDQVNGNKVVDIKQDRVILNDGNKDIELKLEQ